MTFSIPRWLVVGVGMILALYTLLGATMGIASFRYLYAHAGVVGERSVTRTQLLDALLLERFKPPAQPSQ